MLNLQGFWKGRIMDTELWKEVEIGDLRVPNRFVRSATWEGMCDENGCPTPGLARCYRDLVRGGVGLIVTGYTYVHPSGKQMVGTLGLHTDATLPCLKELTDAVHLQGGLIFCQLFHAGAQTSIRIIGEQPFAPSSVATPFYSGVPREMDTGEIARVVECFADAARRAKVGGFDGVQLHGAHGYLINQFLSPLTNRRRDGYGGSRQNRFRFLQAICLAVRQEVGPGYPVTIKLSGSDNLEGGMDIEDAVDFARRLEKLGIDAIEVSAGTSGSGNGVPVRKGINREDKEAYNAGLVRRVKEVVDIPVMLVGGLRSFPLIQRLFREGYADMFSLSRPLIREPDLVNRWRGEPDHRSTCISCNKCFRPGMREGGIYCVIDKAQAS